LISENSKARNKKKGGGKEKSKYEAKLEPRRKPQRRQSVQEEDQTYVPEGGKVSVGKKLVKTKSAR